jgi:hypothetical protein
MYVNVFPEMPFDRTLEITKGQRVVIVGNLEQLPE